METRQCQNCKVDFKIEIEDFDFYKKINVPPPTFCPECRLQRRLVWMKGLDLFKRKCDLCGEMKISMYHPEAPYVVYCTKCWWSDKWDGSDYPVEYDNNKNFLQQWNELLHKVPLLGISIDAFSGEYSPYTNHVGNSKNAYLVYYSDFVEDSANGVQYTHSKNVFDSASIMNCENIYDTSNLYKSNSIIGGFSNNTHSLSSFFIRDCTGTSNCFIGANFHNVSNIFEGIKISKEEYLKKINEIDLGSYKNYIYWKDRAKNYLKTQIPRPSWDINSVNCTGSYVFQSKNCKECYDVTECEDSKFLMMVKLSKVKDTYDYTDWGENVENSYECCTVGGGVNNILFTHESGFNVQNLEYSKLTGWSSKDCFGCVGVTKGEYMILNKKYTKKEYEKLREKIIEDMNNNPYISKSGHEYKYGEFFPPEFSPHAYNDSFASKFFPLTKEEVIERGLKWYEPEKREYEITMQNSEIPDNIRDVDESIMDEVIQCSNCVRGYKIIPQEFEFLKQNKLPLPRMCPFCRIWEKVDNWVLNMKLHDRTCDKCGTNFRTHYDKDRAPVIYCKDCYLKEYY